MKIFRQLAPKYGHLIRVLSICLTLSVIGIVVVEGAISWVDESSHWHHLVIHAGHALIVAGVLAAVFDIWFHKILFGDPVAEIETRMEKLNGQFDTLGKDIDSFKSNLSSTRSEFAQWNITVQTFSQILRTAHSNGVVSLNRRLNDNDKIAWKQTIRERIESADQFVLLSARTLSDLLPVRGDGHSGILQPLTTALPRKSIIVLLPNTYDEDGEFRAEAEVIRPTRASALYTMPRYSIQQLLEIARQCLTINQVAPRLAIRLLRRSPPFALFMTEKSALIEPYLPYQQSGDGLIFEVLRDKQLYDAHRRCFRQLYEEARPVDEVLQDYLARKPEAVRRYQGYVQTAKDIRQFADQVLLTPSILG